MNDLRIIDSHVHLWDTNFLNYPWLEKFEPLRPPALPADYAAAWSGRRSPSALVHVQADVRQDLALEEVDWVAGLDSEIPLAGIVGSAVLERGAAVEEEIQDLRERPLVKGVRRNTQDAPAGTVCSPSYVEGMVRTAKAGLTIDLCVRGHQLPEVVQGLEALFNTVPEARVVIDHLGKPAMTDAGLAEWTAHMKNLVQMPDVFTKISGLVTEVPDGQWTAPQVKAFAATAIDVFGTDRVMVGTDWPVITLASTVDRWWSVIDDLVAELSEPEATQLLSGTAARFYGLDLDG